MSYHFDPQQAERAVRFIESNCLVATTGKPLKLLPWQREFVEQLYGERDENGDRRYRTAVLSCGKKNGKNLIGSSCATYELYGNVQPSPFVVSCSTTVGNAEQILDEMAFTVRSNPKLNKISHIVESKGSIRVKARNGRYQVFSSSAGAAEGKNISALIVDELHAHVNDDLYRSVEESTSARPNGFNLIISTAGNDQSKFWYELFQTAQKVQRGEIQDDTMLARIFTAPPEADIEDPATWRLANPSLGTSFSEAYIRGKLNSAKAQGMGALLNFKQRRLNQWVQPEDYWIDLVKWDACNAFVTMEELKSANLWLGLDLSQRIDLSSLGLCFALPNRTYYVMQHSWICDEGYKQRENSNRQKYREYRAGASPLHKQIFGTEGTLTVTPGTANEYRSIHRKIHEIKAMFPNLKMVIFDQYNALEMMPTLRAEGIDTFEMPPTHKYWNGPIKDFEIAVSEKRIKHDGDKLLRWAVDNARLDVDSYNNCKLSKDKNIEKIDPLVCVLHGYARAVPSTAGVRKSVYDTRPIMVL